MELTENEVQVLKKELHKGIVKREMKIEQLERSKYSNANQARIQMEIENLERKCEEIRNIYHKLITHYGVA